MSDIEDLRIRVGDMEKSYAEISLLLARREERSKTTGEKVDRLYSLLIGEGEQAKPSITVRVDRLEQSEQHRRWLWAGMIGLGFNAIWEWLKGGK